MSHGLIRAALRLGRFFRNSARFWLNLQTGYDLEVEADRLGTKLVKQVEVLRRTGEAGSGAVDRARGEL